MPNLVDLMFDPSTCDLVVENGDIKTVSDNEVVQQKAYLGITLQIGFNQYYPDDGWDWMKYSKATIGADDVKEIVAKIKSLCEEMDFVVSATPVYIGYQPVGSSQGEHIFDVKITSTFGTISVPAALGGFHA